MSQGVYVHSRPFPGHVPLPVEDRGATARVQLEYARRRIASRAPCPATCPQCFGGHAEATGHWEYFGHGIGRCTTCEEPCRSTDPEGRLRHPTCPLVPA